MGWGALIPAAVSAAGSIFGAMSQKKRAKEAADDQHKKNKELMELQQKNQKEMWDATNASATKAHLQKAGLNVGLMYGQGGGGGATTGSGGTGGAGMADYGSFEGVGSLGELAQLGLMRAQKANIEADTANKEQQAAATSAGTEKTKQETESGAIDLEIKKALSAKNDGEMSALERNARAEMEAMNAENRKTSITVQQWIETMLDSKDPNAEMNADLFGGYMKGKNPLLGKLLEGEAKGVIQAAVNSAKQLELMKKEGRLKDADLVIKQLEANVLKLDSTLADFGLGKQTNVLLNTILRAIVGGK